MKKILLSLLVFGLIMQSAFAFSDLPDTHWTYKNVMAMQEKGIISGFTDGTFKPNESLTREQFITMLVKALKLNETGKGNFTDVEGRWSTEYINIAGYCLVDEGDVLFNPTQLALREDIAMAIVKAKNLENASYSNDTITKFSDYEIISENRGKYVAIAVENGFMSGNANGTFSPKNALTRAEGASVINNLLNSNSNNNSSNTENTIKIRYGYSYNIETADLLNEVDYERYGENYIDIFEIYLEEDALDRVNKLIENSSFEKADLSMYEYTDEMIGVGGEFEVTINNDIILLLDSEWSLYTKGSDSYIIHTPEALYNEISSIVFENAFKNLKSYNSDKITIISERTDGEDVVITDRKTIDYILENLKYCKVNMHESEMEGEKLEFTVDLNNGVKVRTYAASIIGYIIDDSDEYYIDFLTPFNNIVSTLYNNGINEETEVPKILVEKSYMNFAWGFSYHGTVICDDGSVFEFSMNDKDNELSTQDLNKLSESILNNTTNYIGKIDEADLEDIKGYLKDVNEESYEEHGTGGADMGQNSVEIWNYELNKKITLSTFGDWAGINSSETANKLLKVIEKYIPITSNLIYNPDDILD